MIRRGLGIGLTWGSLWLLLALCVGFVISVVDPDSIDPGETQGAILILGPMGVFSGLAFAFLLFKLGRATTGFDLSFIRSVTYGVLGTAAVQVPYLSHGDAGLLPNIGVALVFAAFGGVITLAWLFLARRWFSPQRLNLFHS